MIRELGRFGKRFVIGYWRVFKQPTIAASLKEIVVIFRGDDGTDTGDGSDESVSDPEAEHTGATDSPTITGPNADTDTDTDEDGSSEEPGSEGATVPAGAEKT